MHKYIFDDNILGYENIPSFIKINKEDFDKKVNILSLYVIKRYYSPFHHNIISMRKFSDYIEYVFYDNFLNIVELIGFFYNDIEILNNTLYYFEEYEEDLKKTIIRLHKIHEIGI